jgi:hypothetical protein
VTGGLDLFAFNVTVAILPLSVFDGQTLDLGAALGTHFGGGGYNYHDLNVLDPDQVHWYDGFYGSINGELTITGLP